MFASLSSSSSSMLLFVFLLFVLFDLCVCLLLMVFLMNCDIVCDVWFLFVVCVMLLDDV